MGEPISSKQRTIDGRRRMAVGAEVSSSGETHFRVWAPAHESVRVVLEPTGDPPGARPAELVMEREGEGYFSAIAAVGAGSLYRYRLGNDEAAYPDPASRFQPQGPQGPSQVVDPGTFRWTDTAWRGVSLPGQVIYELHVGTFTCAGTWAAATCELPVLADLGISLVEIMPVADFCGRFGWGYDGVDLFAPTRLYGTPDEMRAFVDRAHALGVGVVLDVVYNHVGPDGNYLKAFAPDYFTKRYETDWGAAINYDGPRSDPVREFFAANAAYWIDEFHLDGLRLDATQDIHDRSSRHVLAEITERVRAAACDRSVVLIAENEPQDGTLVRPPEQNGYGMDALWNDDFHHSVMVAMTGRREAYYSNYLGTAQELVSSVKRGFLYQGQRYEWQEKRRGTPTFDLAPPTFVAYLQNHDQVANSATGARAHTLASAGAYRALTALLLLAPSTPMLFQGQEFAASTPFLFFADHEPDLARRVRAGRAEFLRQFPSIATEAVQAGLPDPSDPRTFERSKLDVSERERHAWATALHRDLLQLRREEPAFRAQRAGGVDGAVLATNAFVLRFFADAADERLLVVNLGADLRLVPAAEPLLAPPCASRWLTQWSSEDPRYDGGGAPDLETESGWLLPGRCAAVLRPEPRSSARRSARNG